MTEPKKLKNGKWSIRPTYKDPITGEWKKRYKRFDTKSAARKWAEDVRSEAEHGYSEHDKVGLNDYYQHWMDVYKKPFIEQKTINRISSCMNAALRYFGPAHKLADINRAKYQVWLNKASLNHAHATVLSYHTTFKAMMETAVDEGTIMRNPCTRAKVGGTPREWRIPRQDVFTLAEYKQVLGALLVAPDSVAKYICIVQAFTGMRIGEVLAMRWDSINRFTHRIDVEHSYNQDTHQVSHLKDHTDPRNIKVQDTLFQYLDRYRDWRHQAETLGTVIPYDHLMFTGHNGRPLTTNGVNKYLYHLCDSVGIVRITSHGWRRTQATLMTLAAVDNKFIAAFLGHTVQTLEKYYVRETEDLQKQNLELREQFFHDQGIG